MRKRIEHIFFCKCTKRLNLYVCIYYHRVNLETWKNELNNRIRITWNIHCFLHLYLCCLNRWLVLKNGSSFRECSVLTKKWSTWMFCSRPGKSRTDPRYVSLRVLCCDLCGNWSSCRLDNGTVCLSSLSVVGSAPQPQHW